MREVYDGALPVADAISYVTLRTYLPVAFNAVYSLVTRERGHRSRAHLWAP
jgi:hypothetical protein